MRTFHIRRDADGSRFFPLPCDSRTSIYGPLPPFPSLPMTPFSSCCLLYSCVDRLAHHSLSGWSTSVSRGCMTGAGRRIAEAEIGRKGLWACDSKIGFDDGKHSHSFIVCGPDELNGLPALIRLLWTFLHSV